jgi:hypothetical protein
MADKKVERSGRERPLTPAQKLSSSLSDPGTVSMADVTHDKGKSALVDRFKGREERWRREQALRDREVPPVIDHNVEDAQAAGKAAEPGSPGEGGRP